ncbi:exodeoxyribonuclease VII large subunit [Paenibacillus alvei]|uniref:Exodeoxyribonuclease 7 large subunit n=1 Tax=Paenibacillus alvei TaxID=44250 RepID=A0AAP6ZTZ5_PAEAL|nr:exodeoxyribonuclease VII large subunit [Paenibacillus alvei]MBG9733775.1 exodeoxyribonuclease VII large subunit [Paenibacillus alvei]MBG9745682.1 exodeoxyribonuclease VII large subunit [Paenibacillus alvei]NOJ69140.1 exodeoxyribonuclease VII large subunit [Paenibacillus alvei]
MSEEARILTIKDVNRYIRMKMEGDARLQDIWLRGEISNFTHHSSGHMYFTLKDSDSRIRTIMFASHNQKLAFRPKEGTKVIARGNITVYERDGQYQFYAQHMQPDGIGSLFMAFEQLKERLSTEGLFAEERKRSIPRYPAAIGVITSPTGAAVRDILITLRRRQPGVTVLLYPVLVQGTQAAGTIAQAIEAMNRSGEVDVLIVGRGGGSLEELWAFNEEVVARAIAASSIPVISAVGHETDFTISDFVADLRAPTPTAAAELAVTHRDELRQHLTHVNRRLQSAMNRILNQNQERLLRIQQSVVFRKPEQLMMKHADKVGRLREQLAYRLRLVQAQSEQRWKELRGRLREQTPVHQVRAARKRLDGNHRQLVQAMTSITKQKRMETAAMFRQLDALSPLKIMSRGYSLVYDEQETKLIRSIEEVQLGDVVRVTLSDGQLDCQVWSMKGERE